MGIRSTVLAATTLILSTGVNAAIISTDWQNAGDNLITQDMTTGLEWLDLTVTTSRSYNDISSKFGFGQEFEGWRYATRSEVSAFYDAFGGDSFYYNVGWSTQNNGLFASVSAYWGDTYCADTGCTTGDGFSQYFAAEPGGGTLRSTGMIFDAAYTSESATMDYVQLNYDDIAVDTVDSLVGSALVRVVPIPPAAWLFGSGLLGLTGVARRKIRL